MQDGQHEMEHEDGCDLRRSSCRKRPVDGGRSKWTLAREPIEGSEEARAQRCAFVFLFVIFVVGLLSKDDIGGDRAISTLRAGLFWKYSAHAQMVRPHALANAGDMNLRGV